MRCVVGMWLAAVGATALVLCAALRHDGFVLIGAGLMLVTLIGVAIASE